MESPRYEHYPLRRALTLAGVGVLALNLVGCAELDSETPSIIVSHEYDEGHLVSVKPYIYDDEDFILNLEQCGYDANLLGVDEDGCVTKSIEVTEETYNRVEDGQSITYDRTYIDGGLPVTIIPES